jgi:curved DNA-binding protein CbpA
MIRNPYEVLGIKEGATMDEIKRAYRKKARENHPDLHPEDPSANEKMQQINEAYEMLSNPDKYARQRQAQDNPYGQRAYDSYARKGQAYGPGNWQYTYYTADDAEAWRAWQEAWNNAAQQQQSRKVRVFNPFRGIIRVVSGLLLFRFVTGLLRILLFGFLR